MLNEKQNRVFIHRCSPSHEAPRPEGLVEDEAAQQEDPHPELEEHAEAAQEGPCPEDEAAIQEGSRPENEAALQEGPRPKDEAAHPEENIYSERDGTSHSSAPEPSEAVTLTVLKVTLN